MEGVSLRSPRLESDAQRGAINMKIAAEVYVRPDIEAENGFRFFVCSKLNRYMSTGQDDIKLHDVEVEVPDFDDGDRAKLSRQAVSTLRQRKQDVLAMAQRESDRLDEKIFKLLQLEHFEDIDKALADEQTNVHPISGA